MPGLNGVAATRAILQDAPGTQVVILSMHSEDTLVRHAMTAGARGYVLKSAIDLDLAGVVKRAAAGEMVLDPRLSAGQQLKGDRGSVLTPRELQVLQFICDGKSNREIAAALDLSVNTVAVHRANIMNALGIHKTAELVVYAIRNGLARLP
jgi:DNA-binding NarL/FixJ family response regulator